MRLAIQYATPTAEGLLLQRKNVADAIAERRFELERLTQVGDVRRSRSGGANDV